MPIYALTNREVSQLCIHCKVTHEVPLDTLEVSSVTDQGAVAGCVVMPACAICGSGETLIGLSDSAPEHPRPGSFNHLHGLLVDQLHLHLLAAGRVATESAARAARVRRVPPEALARWVPGGLNLSLPPELLVGGAPRTGGRLNADAAETEV
jgi:hypothetical protein